uniref:SAM domain-containing protein n=1 Tax=Calcidiscus leptoporus TaxID=127549 RepID=A0A7S0J0U9_9EUKA|mmetsp:Transcript_31884/g.74282  ORF Transcript_31884/g.74282 Transcript_31884/m.74282 type:complete len:235 (+) Transcript_31884:695-1399(+)
MLRAQAALQTKLGLVAAAMATARRWRALVRVRARAIILRATVQPKHATALKVLRVRNLLMLIVQQSAVHACHDWRSCPSLRAGDMPGFTAGTGGPAAQTAAGKVAVNSASGGSCAACEACALLTAGTDGAMAREPCEPCEPHGRKRVRTGRRWRLGEMGVRHVVKTLRALALEQYAAAFVRHGVDGFMVRSRLETRPEPAPAVRMLTASALRDNSFSASALARAHASSHSLPCR